MVPRIRQVQIQNYKSIERAVVDLEPFTVFVGPNGAGKSNFVDALAFVQECLSESIQQAWNRRHRSGLLPIWMEEPVSFGIKLVVDLAENQSAEYAFEIASENDQYRVVHEKGAVWGPQGAADFELTDGRFIREIPGIRPKLSANRLALFAASATEEFSPLYEFLTSVRSYSIDPRRLRQWQELDAGVLLEPDGRNAASVLAHLRNGAGDKERYKLLCALLSRVVPGVQGISVTGVEGRAILEFEVDVGTEQPGHLAATEMSDGTLRILGLLLAVLQAQQPSVLVIEEPETTVYPASAGLILQVLLHAVYDCQVVITTHSADILDEKEVSDDQLRVVTKENGRTIIAPVSQASRQAIRERLYTAGDLLRINELSQDVEAAQTVAKRLDLFKEISL